MHFTYPHPLTDMDDEPGLCPSQAMTNVYALLRRGKEGGKRREVEQSMNMGLKADKHLLGTCFKKQACG